MRPVRAKLKFDEESVNKLLQEIYIDTHVTRAKIVNLFTRWNTKVKEGGEIAAIGDQIIKLLSVEAKNQDQKLMLLKFLKEVVFVDKTSKKGSPNEQPEEEKAEITSDRRNELLKFVQDEIEKKENSKK
jgi:hypothetical protein